VRQNQTTTKHDKKMNIATVKIAGVAPYSQSRYHGLPKEPKETHEDYENRTWKEKGHWDAKSGHLFIPPMAIKQALDAAVKRTGKQIPGKGKATYTKHFLGGVMVFDPVFIEDERGHPYTRENITQWSGMMSSTGEKGKAGGKVVLRHFPDAPTWNATVTFHVMDETVTKDVFTEMLEEAGKFIGLGRFRPQNGGFYGRFAVESVDWQ
jgi:hypothetical protein